MKIKRTKALNIQKNTKPPEILKSWRVLLSSRLSDGFRRRPALSVKRFNRFLNACKLTRFAHLAFAPLCTALFFSKHSLSGAQVLAAILSFILIDTLGLQTGFHKLLAHKSFKTNSFWTNSLAFSGLFSGQGSPLVWSAVHRSLHHPFADRPADPHTPEKGFFHSFIAWYWRWDAKDLNLNSVRDLLSSKFLVFLHKTHTLILWAGFSAVFLIFGPAALVTVLLIPMTLSLFLTGLVNACLHTRKRGPLDWLLLTYKNYPTEDGSKNSLLLGPLTGGLAYHNNHHRFPDRFNPGIKPYEQDLSRFFVYLIRKKG